MAATLRALAGTHMVLVTAEGTHGPRIAEVRSPAKTGSASFEGVDSLYPDCRAGRPPTLTLSQSIKRLAPGRPKDHLGLRSTWSLARGGIVGAGAARWCGGHARHGRLPARR